MMMMMMMMICSIATWTIATAPACCYWLDKIYFITIEDKETHYRVIILELEFFWLLYFDLQDG